MVRKFGVYIVSDIIYERDGWLLVRYSDGYHLCGAMGSGWNALRFEWSAV